MKRRTIPIHVETKVLTSSGRRCCICYGLSQDLKVKEGQLAHIDQNPSNTEFDNLAWLCFTHHDQFDSRTSQSKNLTPHEVKEYRQELYDVIRDMKRRHLPFPQDPSDGLDSTPIHSESHADDACSYAPSAIADIDFYLDQRSEIAMRIRKLKSHNWDIQNRAMYELEAIDFTEFSKDEAFVLGRNIYQAACGGAWSAVTFVKDLRKRLSAFPPGVARHILCGMFFEIYFDSKGEFRKLDLKSRYVTELFKLQTVTQYSECISFIANKLTSFAPWLSVIPNNPPLHIELTMEVTKIKKGCFSLKRLIYNKAKELLSSDEYRRHRSQHPPYNRRRPQNVPKHVWKLSLNPFTKDTFLSIISEAFYIPREQIDFRSNVYLQDDDSIVLPKNTIINYPYTT